MIRKDDYNLFFTTWMSRACLALGVIVLGYIVYEIMVNSIEPVIRGMIGIIVIGFFGVSAACGSAARKLKRTNL